jgi:hypothetical protein
MKILTNLISNLIIATVGALLYAWHPAIGVGYVAYLLVVNRGAKC